MSEFRGLATGVGSLPHQEVESALDLVFQYVPRIPFWPQLPKRDTKESMIAQFTENFPCLKIIDKDVVFDPGDKDRELERFYEKIIAKDVDYFKLSENFASGLYGFYQRLEGMDLKDIMFIKCHVTGPFTLAASIYDDNGIALLHNKVYFQAVLKGLAAKALWQINLFRKFGKKIILFIDEPYLGCFGSAYTPINREDVITALGELISEIKSEGVYVGAHCCGNTDWSIFTDVDAIDIISFDAFDYMERLLLYADNLGAFFKRGGILCWGIVPTQLFSGEETPEILIRKIKDGIDRLVKKGLDEDLLLENLLISPSCGLGTYTAEKSEKIFRLLSETSSLIVKYS